ncbi:MAG: type IV pilin, partial [Candidatus Bathyarchaeia archaeon]
LALSTVITTLIILVVSVLLAGVVTYFAINVVSTRVQQESLSVPYAHIWVDSSGNAVGALMITNTGGRDIVINQIEVRGQPVFPAATVVTFTATPGTDLTSKTQNALNGATSTTGLTTGPIVLDSGKSINVYIVSPGSVSTSDIGTTISFTVFTAQAAYYTETNVQASSTSLAP